MALHHAEQEHFVLGAEGGSVRSTHSLSANVVVLTGCVSLAPVVSNNANNRFSVVLFSPRDTATQGMHN